MKHGQVKGDESCCHSSHELHHESPKPKLLPPLISLALAAASMGVGMTSPEGMASALLSGGLALAVVVLYGRKFLIAIGKIFRSSDMNTLIGIGIVASFGLSIWNIQKGDFHHLYFDTAAFVAAFVLLGQYFEALIQNKMNEQMSSLTSFLPQKVRVISGVEEHLVEIGQLKVGQQLKVLVGERVPADAKILNEAGATFDESILTGESKPVTRAKNEAAIQGALNVGQPVILEVTEAPENSLYQKLVAEVRASLKVRPKIQQTVDRVATIFVPFVVLVSIGVAVMWRMLRPESDLFIQTAISVLVIACPCALGIATPTALFVGALRASRKGILLKSLDAVDRIGDITIVAFDKTGTLTEGRPAVQRMKGIENFPTSEILQLAVSVEQDSEHPYAVAIRNRASSDRVKVLPATDLKIGTGRGVSGRVKTEKGEVEVVVGNLNWFFENDFDSTRIPQDLQWEADGTQETAIWVGVDKKILGIIFVADQIRGGSAQVVAALSDQGYDVGMITGDTEPVARSFAKILKLKYFHAGVLPDEKATIIKRLHQPKKKGLDFVHHKVAFIGDGVNDGPALAEAHLGIAMGSGAALSQSAADVVLASNDILQVEGVFKILKSTKSLILQNLALGFGYNLLAIPLAAGALIPWNGFSLNPMIAAAAMAASSISVLLNSLRALKS